MFDTLAKRLAKVLPETRSDTLTEEIVDIAGTLEEMRH